ncbi:MAG: putative quinol monooxygenase [Chloroflexota bacterium]
MAHYGLIGKMTTEADNRDAFLEILSEASAMMMAREDCLLYLVSKDAEDETAIWVTEVWTSQEAHGEAVQLPEVRALIGQGMPLIIGTPTRHGLIPVAGIPS